MREGKQYSWFVTVCDNNREAAVQLLCMAKAAKERGQNPFLEQALLLTRG